MPSPSLSARPATTPSAEDHAAPQSATTPNRDGLTRASETFLKAPDIHDAWASDYLDRELDGFYERAFDRLATLLPRSNDAQLLDAGCGSCLHAARLLRRGFRVTGIDFSDSALENARQYLSREGLLDRMALSRGDLLDLPFADDSFDAVLSWGVLMHIPQLERALAELVRVLRDRGRLILMENNAASLHVRMWEPALLQLKKLLGRSVPQRHLTKRGVEAWESKDDGGLMVRKTDIGWLVSRMSEHGLELVERLPGQFTEVYTTLPMRPLKRLVYRFNEAYLALGGPPELALGNMLVFERRPRPH